MRPLTLLVLVALGVLAALVAVAATFADSPGARPAFALVDPNNGSPRVVTAHTQGFVDVNQRAVAGPGDYCLTPAPGVDVTDTAAVASEEAFYSNAVGIVTVRYQPDSPNCTANQLEVKTFASGAGDLSDQIAFTVNVP